MARTDNINAPGMLYPPTKALLITETFVNSRGGDNAKLRWECPICRQNKASECRFNLSVKKINCDWKCRFCGTTLRLER